MAALLFIVSDQADAELSAKMEEQLPLRGYEALVRVGGGMFGRVYHTKLADDSFRALQVERSLGYSQLE